MTTLRIRLTCGACLLGALVLGSTASRLDAALKSKPLQLPLAGFEKDPAIPTMRKVLGHDWGAAITRHDQMEQYLHAIAEAAPDRVRLVRYGASYEERGLYYLAISSADNIKRLEQIRSANQRLADPRRTDMAEAAQLISSNPAIIWLASSVHGNELSGTEAMLLTAYHLLADRRPTTTALLDDLVVLIDPLQNPDGRARFVSVYRESRGPFSSANPLSTEHAERWPGGRYNHYLFDMNRDWFLQSQRETVCKVRAYLHWQPQIYVDAHEMGRNSSYFFVPPTDPINPFMLPKQNDWLWKLGEQQAAWFDRHGFAYTTREIFDAFYPGYGSEWPTLQGGLGVLWEQAGTRGLLVDRSDDTLLHYRDAISHHYIGALATVEIAAQQRAELLRGFFDARARGIQLGEEGPVKHFFLPVTPRPNRTVNLARLLQRNGVDVYQLVEDVRIRVKDTRSGKRARRTIRKGSFHIPVAQPAGRLLRALLDQHVGMDEDFVKRQLERKEDQLPDQIYDVTAWSLPLAFDVPCFSTADKVSLAPETWNGKLANAVELAEAKVAYLVQPTDGAMEALSAFLQQGIRVHVTDEEFAIGTNEYPGGTLILKIHDNRPSLRGVVEAAAKRFGLQVSGSDTGFVTEGAHFGGPHVRWVRPPKIVLATDRPAQGSVGHTWYLFDQVLKYPTTRVSCRNLDRLELHKFNVLILPDGSFSSASEMNESFATRLRQWVREGGTLVLVKGAAVWAASDSINLASLTRVAKPTKEEAADEESKTSATGYSPRQTSGNQWPDSVPGAFLKATLFDQHWMTFGCPKSMSVFCNSNVFFEPLLAAEGRNIVQLDKEETLLSSGFCWPETRALIAGKTFLAYKAMGEGHIIAFAGDPNYRAMYPSMQRLFINACLLGPGQ